MGGAEGKDVCFAGGGMRRGDEGGAGQLQGDKRG